MSEEKKVIFCTQCGGENDYASRFCSNCGAKMAQEQPEEQTIAQPEAQAVQPEGVFSGEEAAPDYEKVTEAAEVKPDPFSNSEDLHINYGREEYSTPYSAPPVQNYAPVQAEMKEPGGNIGFAIASLVCGILSILCCCFYIFSIILGIVAVVLGIITISQKYAGKGIAIAGMITGGIGLVFFVLGLLFTGTSAYMDLVNEIANELY